MTIQPVFPYFLKTKLAELEEATSAALEESTRAAGELRAIVVPDVLDKMLEMLEAIKNRYNF